MSNMFCIFGVIFLIAWWLFCIIMLVKKDDWNWLLLALIGIAPIGLIGSLAESILQ